MAQFYDIAQKLFDNRKEVSGIFAHDVKILASDGEILAHRSVLGARSPYFESSINQLLATNDPQLQVQVVTLDETSFTQDVIECLIRYIYLPGEEPTILDISRLEKILEASTKFGRGEFTQKYLQQLITNAGQLITKDNWSTWFTLGVTLVLSEGYFNQIYLFLGEKYPQFYSSEEFLKLSIHDLRIILNSVNRPFKSGTDDLLSATFKWVGANGSEFSEELIKLWKDHQNPATGTSSSSGPNNKDNNSKVKKSLENNGNDNRRKRILEDTQSIDSQNEDSDDEDGAEINQKSKKVKMEGRHKDLIEIDDDDNDNDEFGNTYSSEFDTDTDSDQEFSQDTQQLLFFGKYKKSYRLCSYDLDTNLLSRVGSMPIKGLKNMRLITANNDDGNEGKIYCLGGIVGSRIETSVHSFLIEELGTFRNEPWKRELKMELSSKRKDFASVIVGDTLYMLGGYDGMTENLIEGMDLSCKRLGWIKADMTMNYYRELFDVAYFNNTIYIAGGYGKRHIEGVSDALRSAEAYNIDSEEVSGLPLMNIPRVALRLVHYKEKIYAIGGYHYYQGNKVKLASIEVLDIGNIAKGWTLGPSLTTERAGGYAFVSDDSIYYVGGDTLDSDDEESSYTMEKLNFKKNEWEIVESNLPKIADFSSCAIIN